MIKRSKTVAILIVVILILSAVSGLILLTIQSSTSYQPFDQGPVRPGDAWGRVETFGNAPPGTKATFGDLKFYEYDVNEAVVLGGSIWMLSKGTSSNVQMAEFDPTVGGPRANFSFEAYAPRDYLSWKSANRIPGEFAVVSYLTTKDGTKLAGVELSVGDQASQKISVYDGSTDRWSVVTTQMLPPLVHKGTDDGSAPDRYIVSFATNGSEACKVTVSHSSAGKIYSGYFANHAGPGALLKFFSNSKIVSYDSSNLNGGWFVDNIACRGASARYPIVGPVYEHVGKSQPLWLSVENMGGKPISDAAVSIAGVDAKYNPTNQRYEASVPREVDWSKPTNYSVTVDGVTLVDTVMVTTLPDLQNVALPLWWNGWDWVSVLGEDDSSGPETAANAYAAYNHPYTAYLWGTGADSSYILSKQSEIALHYPHVIGINYGLFWDDAVRAASEGESFLRDNYDFASRWDDPSYVGRGDSYIGLAYPGNSGTYEYEYALYNAGVRIGGISSHPEIAPGNFSIVGCWWMPDGYQATKPVYSWYPCQPMDLLDASRQMRVDKDTDVRWGAAMYAAEHSGVLRIYNHPADPIPAGSSRDEILRWIDEPKGNYSLENWKATDGEVASYVYGRWTTDVKFNQSSNSSTTIFDVSRKDPLSAGYWLVPVTLAIDAQGRIIDEIQIVEGNKTYSSSDGSLRNLDGKRIMDVGYDIRDGKLYVSQFWNKSAVLKITYASPLGSSFLMETKSIPAAFDLGTMLETTQTESMAAVRE